MGGNSGGSGGQALPVGSPVLPARAPPPPRGGAARAARPATARGPPPPPIRPDDIVFDDTVTTAEREFARAIAPQQGKVLGTIQDYALELKRTVTPNFTVQAEWLTELMQRMTKAGVTIDPKYSATAHRLIA